MIRRVLSKMNIGGNEVTAHHEFMLGFSLLSALNLMIFSVLRFIEKSFFIAALDFLIAIGLILACFYAVTSGKIRRMSMMLICIMGIWTLFLIYAKGYHVIYWSFSTTVASFYILKQKEALVFSSLLLLGSFALVYDLAPIYDLLAFLISFVMITIFSYMFSRRAYEDKLYLLNQSLQDPLTGVANRRSLDDDLNRIVSIPEGEERSASAVSALMIDIDFFKQVNDEFGHDVGDQVLTSLSRFLSSLLPEGAKLYRQGGEEFVIILPSDQNTAFEFAESIRSELEAKMLIAERKITISVGVAGKYRAETSRDWMKRADDALYAAKSLGRNQVQISDS